ncbi:hypothetical protein C5S35_16810, partial [Candidatus Methanophagaceae archaeon]
MSNAKKEDKEVVLLKKELKSDIDHRIKL